MSSQEKVNGVWYVQYSDEHIAALEALVAEREAQNSPTPISPAVMPQAAAIALQADADSFAVREWRGVVGLWLFWRV
jgi:hypothetical protein